ncbi:MAG: 2-phosphosulfolactate phosphatase [Acidimicrobiia bacterium]
MATATFGMGIDGASKASGTTVVIDTFRAFTTAAVLFDAGIDRLYLAATLDEARQLAGPVRGLLCGEDDGRRPPDFELSNSPYEASVRVDLAGKTVVQRTSSGTRSVVAALRAGAQPVFAASFVVASATAAAASGGDGVTIISAGLRGTEPAEEDDLTARFIANTIDRSTPDIRTAERIRTCDRAVTLMQASWAHPGDVDIAADLDRYPFAMEAVIDANGQVQLVRSDS